MAKGKKSPLPSESASLPFRGLIGYQREEQAKGQDAIPRPSTCRSFVSRYDDLTLR
jgi:hypothetical protein